MVKGTVFDIQRFSLNDGPGVRTTVFLKGCPMRCIWCHNPEGLSSAPQLRYDSEKCIGCMDCAALCACHKNENGIHILDRSGCTECGRCADVCPSSALEIVGKIMTADEVISVVSKDIKYYKNGGGLTLSGGEPLFQPEFSAEILKMAKEKGINTAIETGGYAKNDIFMSVVGIADLILFDFKLTDCEKHIKYTGVSNEIILRNLTACSAPVILRCPVIPGINDEDKHFDGIVAVSEQVKNLLEIHIEPYHTLGLSKTAALGMKNSFEGEILTVDTAEEICEKIRKRVSVPVKVSK